MEGVYSLMPDDEAAANGGSAGDRPRTKSSPFAEKLSTNHEHSRRRLTDIVKRKPRNSSTNSDTPLISQNESVNGSESNDTAAVDTDHITMQMNEDDVFISEAEEDDVLTPLSELPPSPSKQKGILKRSTVVDSGSFSGYVSSPTSIHSPPPLSPSVNSPPNREWRRESKVQFKPQPPINATVVELRALRDESGGTDNSEFEYVDSQEEEFQRIDDRLTSGSRIRSSLTRLTKYRSKGVPPPRKKLQRLQSQLDLDDLSRNEVELKANLYFHIGNPIKRWKVERVVPIKLLLQLLKTFCLIVQVILFTKTLSHKRSDFFYNSRVIFESLFIQRFQNGVTMPRDTYTAYSIQDMYSEFEYISRQYFHLREITIGGYDYASVDDQGNPTPIIMELTQYTVAELNTVNNSYVLDGRFNETVFYIEQNDNATQSYLDHSQDPLFHRFISLTVRMQVKNIRVVHPERAECFFINVSINYNNEDSRGQILYHLEEKHTNLDCNENILTDSEVLLVTYGAMTALDVMIILLCCFSIGLTIKSLQRAKKLAKAMGTFYRRELGIKLSWWERRSLFPLWHVINIVSDLLIIAGSFYKIFVDYMVNGLDDANPTSVLLGTAVLCQAGVILRYISYFKELNALTRTISLAFPELLKFLLCAGILFLAFTFNGWIILGPYHEKFVGFGGSFETLFSLINGDDIYTTFTGIDMEDSVVVYVYSRLYMYVFLILFLYFVLNLFTSLVISAYEASRSYNTAYENEVRRFVFSGPLTPNGVALRDVTRTKNYVDPEVIKKRLKQPPPKSRSPQQQRGDSWLQSAETVD